MIMEMSLRKLADRRNIQIGTAAVPDELLTDTEYATVLAREYNCLVAENVMKFTYLHPERDVFDFTKADALIAFAEKNKMKVRGHTLVWHSQLPEWLANGDFSRKAALNILEEYIFTVMEHFKGKIDSWDVVNEVIEDTYFSFRTKSKWYQMIGADYVELAFRWAKEADPDTLLFYNDYDLEAVDGKFEATMRLLHELNQKNTPIDGIGFQFHSLAADVFKMRKIEKFTARMKRLKEELNLKVHITELDLAISPKPSTEELTIQANAYRAVLKSVLNSDNCNALVMWGFTDKHSWIPSFTQNKYDNALIFDREYQAKPAWHALINELSENPEENQK